MRPPATARPVRPPHPPVRRRRRALRLGALSGRLRFGFAAVCTLLLVVGGRLVQLQGLDHDKYALAAADQRTDHVVEHALRGQILDRNGVELAYTSAAQDVVADPLQIVHYANQQPKGSPNLIVSYAKALAPLVGLSQGAVAKVINNSTSQYAMVATAVSPVAAQKISDLDLVGIYTEPTTKREYPGATTAANIIGTVHSNGAGAAGIESEYNKVLAGRNGSLTYSVDSSGDINPSSKSVGVPARNGGTVRLTIDQNLQYTAQQYLDEAVAESGATNAEMVALDAHNGQVLAMASSGTFNSSDPNTINPNVPMNPPVMSAFEPGSVQKAITFAAALQGHLITPKTVFNVPDSIEMGGVTINDAWIHSDQPMTATGILAQSSNVGTLKIAKLIGPKVWDSYENKFGVGKKTGIELPGESSGYLPPLKDWSASSFANLPFGQGESMTVLQLASIYQTFANNGVRIPPRIVQSVTDPNGTSTVTKTPKGIRVVSAQTAETVRTMLESVILPGGTGQKAAVPGYIVAGKTGTAQQPDPNTGKYSNWRNWDTFAGMIPADNPQIVVAIMVDNPADRVEGGDVAAPLFSKIASYEVAHAHIPPTGAKAKYVPLDDCKGLDPRYLPANVCFP